MHSRLWLFPILLATTVLSLNAAGAQTFVRVTSGNPIVTGAVPSTAQYAGCAWADFDNDGDQDLYIVQQGLYRNNGGGSFTKLTTMPADHNRALGCSWGDADNDGDLDLFISGAPAGGSYLNRNDGGGVFTRVTGGVIGDVLGNMGWGCAWGDYDNDGMIDMVIAAANGFLGISTPNHLLHNEGGLVFTRVDTSTIATVKGPYTVPSWNDFDDDGDLDLFIAAGPASGVAAPDFLYENLGTAPGESVFKRITTGALATDLHDGQLYNWIDYDADGDLDCYVTNYGGTAGLANDLYRNTAGVFEKQTAEQAGSIVSDAWLSLASVWGDFDNDGDLDCLVTNDSGTISIYYINEGNGHFITDATSVLRYSGPHYGAAAADYDGDGDLDLYMHGNSSTRGLYRNASPDTNGWLNVRCAGVSSNRAAIGSRVWVYATIGGVARQLVQLVSAQNSFNGHNALELHFGTGNATVVDSVVVRFPGGYRQTVANVAPRQTLTLTEDVVTATQVSVVSSEATLGGTRVRWQLGAADIERVNVYRRTESSAWMLVMELPVGERGWVNFEDHAVEPGVRYAYELALTQSGIESRWGMVWVEPAVGARVRVEWLGGNPVRGALELALTSPTGGDADLTMVDAAGRAVMHRRLSGLTRGRQLVSLGSSASLRAGVYWIRINHAAVSQTIRAVVLN